MGISNDMAMIRDVAKQNNAFNASQAQKQMDFQKDMSNTAHQREVADLQKAGLNPVLSAGGQGASAPQGAKAEADTNITNALTSIISNQMNNSAALQRAQIQANATISAASIAAQNAWAINNANLDWKSNHPESVGGVLNEIVKGTGYSYEDIGKWIADEINNSASKNKPPKGHRGIYQKGNGSLHIFGHKII